MTAFSTKVGIDTEVDDEDEVFSPPVDNLQEIEVSEAIMKGNETPSD